MTEYSPLDKLLHHLALGSRMSAELLHDVERNVFLKSAPLDEGRHVFVTGLARAGTTIVMREIHGSGAFGSLTYADMPFVLAPNLWHLLSAKGTKPGIRTERAHGDGIKWISTAPRRSMRCIGASFRARIISERGASCRMSPAEGR